MSVDPDSLLIFRLREKQQQHEQEAETEARQQPAAQAQPTKAKEEAQQPQEQPQPKVQAQPSPPLQPPPPPQAKAQPILPPRKEGDTIKIVSPQRTQEEENRIYGRPDTVQMSPNYYPDPRVYYEMGKEYREISRFNDVYTKFKNVKNKAQSRAFAKNAFCAWHPWRHAYSICAYCHRPFCFEDTMEYKKSYYCPEDIDKVSQKHVEMLTSEYNMTSIITALVILATVVTFLYFTNTQIFALVGYEQQIGPLAFVTHISTAQLLLMAGILIMAVELIGAIYAFIGTPGSRMFGTIISILTVAFFVYEYANTATPYFGIISLLAFLSFIFSVYSAATGVQVYNYPSYSQAEDFGMQYWPNAGQY